MKNWRYLDAEMTKTRVKSSSFIVLLNQLEAKMVFEKPHELVFVQHREH